MPRVASKLTIFCAGGQQNAAHRFSGSIICSSFSALSFISLGSRHHFRSMASLSATAISINSARPRVSPRTLGANGIAFGNLVSFSSQSKSFRSLCLQVSCAAKPETVEKVCEIVKQQLALPETTNVTGECKFAELGADSLDTVEIVMGLEEAFNISVEEENAQSIVTVQDAADLIEKLKESKCA